MCDEFIYLIHRSEFFDVVGFRLWYNLNRKNILQMNSNEIKFSRELYALMRMNSDQRLIIIIELD